MGRWAFADVLILATAFTTGCGSVGPSPTAPSAVPTPSPVPAPIPTPTPAPAPAPSPPASSAPAIRNLSAVFTDTTCTRAADHLTARGLAITLDFTDDGSGLAGGRVELDRRYDTGRTEFHIYPIPAEVTVSGGATAGQLGLIGCPLYDNGHTSTETLTLTDARGSTSNSLSITVTRPAGDP